MKFKGNIIITDPCYIIRENPIKAPNPKDFNLPDSILNKPFNEFSAPEEFAFEKAFREYLNEKDKYDDWYNCEYGEHMEVLGINNYLCKDTIYGDWSCTTYQTSTKDIESLINNQSLDYFNPIGEFCADTGMVAVFLLDEVLKYNPNFTKWMEEHSWCVTLIKDFDGDVEYFVDNNDNAHIIGKGNINFFTTQTGL